MSQAPEMLQGIVNSALDAGENPLALGNRLFKMWPTMAVKNAINTYQWNHAGPSGPGVLVRGGKDMSKRALLGKDNFDLVFGESEGAAYEKEVEIHGDDLGSYRAPTAGSSRAPTTGSPSWGPTANTAAQVENFRTSAVAPTSVTPPSSTPNFASIMPNAPGSSLTSVLAPSSFLARANQQTQQTQQTQGGRRRRRHHHGQGQGQGQGQYGQGQYGQGPYGNQYPYGSPGAGMLNTTWPPPAPANLLPGAPWPPPGAAPGSDLSSFYPMGTPQASSAYWNSSQVSMQQPQYAPAAALPMDVYVDNPSYSTLGLAYDSLGRAEIINVLTHGKQRAQRPRSASMGAVEMGVADHKFDVIALRAKLRRIGMDVPKNGSVDQPLADAVNGIFKGWSDAPKGLQAGDMTTKGLRDHIKLVNKLVDQAVGGAQHLEHAENDDAMG